MDIQTNRFINKARQRKREDEREIERERDGEKERERKKVCFIGSFVLGFAAITMPTTFLQVPIHINEMIFMIIIIKLK